MKMMTNIVGIILIIFGIVAFVYQGFTYTKREKVAEIAGLQVTADTEKQVSFPPMLSGLCIIAGVVLVVVGRVGRK